MAGGTFWVILIGWFLSLRYSKGRIVCFAKNCWLKVFLNSANAGPNRIKSVSAECVGLADYTQEGSLADYTQEGSLDDYTQEGSLADYTQEGSLADYTQEGSLAD